MSVETIRTVLGRLQSEPDNAAVWDELTEAVTAPDGASLDEVERLLGQARAKHEVRREWRAVAELLELELMLVGGQPAEVAMQRELARIYQEELLDAAKAAQAFRRVVELDPNDEAAQEAVDNDAAKREKWRDLLDRYLSEAESAGEDAFKSVLLSSAADVGYRYGRDELDAAQLLGYVEQALELDSKNKRAVSLAEMLYTQGEQWENVAQVLAVYLVEGAGREERAAAGLRLGRIYARRLEQTDKAIEVYQQVLDLLPGHSDALSYLAEAYSATEQWDYLVALYEDQLKGGGLKPADEVGILLQIGMVHWRMRESAEAAEPYFDRVRRADPTHGGMLSFFREHVADDPKRLITILTDAQRATKDADEKTALATEIAGLAESQENAQKAIDQYKSVLRTDPDNLQARDALKRLYRQTEGWNALVELFRQDLERAPEEDVDTRSEVLREIASVYRDHAKSDQALVTALTQLVQLNPDDIDAVRELTGVYERLGRWRDLLNYQQKLAALTDDHDEKVELFRAAAQRWLDQFSNVQNAVNAYEGLLEASPRDAEAIEKLRELYQKRRAWPQLYTLYEQRLEDPEGGEDEVELLTEMAKLAAERLDRGADAITHLKRILELDSSASWVFDALEKQAEREKDFVTLAEVLEHRIDAAHEDSTKLTILQKLGGVYADRVNDLDAATRTWKRVLEIQPGQNRALRVLRDAYVSNGDWDGLEELYASQNDWDGLADFLSTAADKSSEPEEKVAISFRAARIYEEELGAPERAMRSYERVLTVQENDPRAAGALVPIYEKEEKWARLPGLYEILLAASDDSDERVSMLRKLAAVTGGPLADKNAALGYARRAYELAPNEEGLELLEAWSRAAGSWEPFVGAVEARLKDEDAVDDDQRRALRLKVAELYARELGKVDDAVALYKKLASEDPTDTDTLATLDELLRSNERRDDLRWLFELRAEQVEGEDRATVYEEWATLEEEVFGDLQSAAGLFRKVIDLSPTRGDALKALARLLIAGESYAEAAEVVVRHRDVCDGEERAEREIELARLYIDHLDRSRDAFEAAVRALELSAHNTAAIDLLSKLIDDPDTRADVAAVLEEEYAAAGDARREAEALVVMLEAEEDPTQRLALHLKLADVEEEKLDAPGRAFDVVLRALNEFPDDISVWDRGEQLADRAGRPTDLAEAYRAHLVTTPEGERRISQAVEVELSERAATLHDEKLGDPEGAMPYLERVLSIDAENQSAFNRLKQILTAAERWRELEELYDRASSAAQDEASKVELLNEVALIAEEIIGDPTKAIGYYERILDIDPLHNPSLDALEKLYEQEERWSELAKLLERRLDTVSQEDALDVKVYLARIYLDRLHTPPSALGHVRDVLEAREDDADARELGERLLEIGELRLEAAKILEVVYEARDEMRNLVRVLDIRREGTDDDGEKRELLHRISELRDERLHDDAGAFETLSELLPLEPEDSEARERFVETGRRLGEHEKTADVLGKAADNCVTPSTKGEILMLVASICEDYLENVERAEQVYRQVIDIDASDPQLVIPATQALSRIYDAQDEHQKLADVLAIEVRLEDDVDRRRSLYERIGELYESELNQPKNAIEAWRSRVADDPGDDDALAALERLYERVEDYRELVGILHAREQVMDDADDRRRAMVKAAETLSEKLDDADEAINGWRSVLDEFGPERPTLQALAALYEKTARWADLAETVDVELTLADSLDERLDLFVRLGDCRRLHLEDLPGALDAYRQSLLLEPNHEASRAALEQMLEIPDARREAAEVLHPLYESEGQADRLLRVLEIEAEEAADPMDRLSILEKALRTAEGPLEDRRRAFAYAMRGVREGAAESDAETWIDTLERLAQDSEDAGDGPETSASEKAAGDTDATDDSSRDEASGDDSSDDEASGDEVSKPGDDAPETSRGPGRWNEVCSLYRDIVDEILDGDVQQKVRLRIGELARTKLSDANLAIEYYRGALDARADDTRAMIALEELYEEGGDNNALLEILRLRTDAAEEDADKVKLSFRMARLQEGPLDDAGGAIDTYESILDIELAEEAVAALEKLYAKAERYNDLVALYERELEAGAESPADLRVKIAKVTAAHLDDTMRAFDELGEALLVDPSHADAVEELEHLLASSDDPEHQARAGEMLEPVYLRRADWASVKKALDARLTASQDPSERAELLQRLATLHEEQLEDYGAALETVALLLHEDLSDEGVWSELERLAKVASAEKRLAEIFAKELEELPADDAQSTKLCQRTGEIYADLGEVEDALKWYRRAFEFEPDSEELFAAIDGLLEREGRHGERVELYQTNLDYREGDRRLQALHMIAQLQRGHLDRKEEAVETYVAALDVDDTDEVSLDALTQLYGELGRDRDLADLYLRRAEIAADPEIAAPFRLSLANLLREKLEDTEGAIDQLQEIVSEVPWHEGAIHALEALTDNEDHKARVVEILRPLYERSDDWRLLIKLNEDRYNLAEEPHEQVAVLRETAELWEQRGNDKERAYSAIRTAFDILPDDAETRAEMERLAEELNSWDKLAASLERGAEATEEEFVKRELLLALAKVQDHRLDDPRSALNAYAALAELDTSDPAPLEAMDTLAVLLADWPVVIDVLQKQADLVSDDEQAALWRRIAGTKFDMLDDSPGAIESYERSLELDPSDAPTIDALLRLYAPEDDLDEQTSLDDERATRVVELLTRRVDLTQADEADLRYELNRKAASIYEAVLDDRREAIIVLGAALDARPDDSTVLKQLERLYRAEEMWDDLLDNLKQQAAGAEASADRAELRTAIGNLYKNKLESPAEALDAYRLVLDEDPAAEAAINSIFEIGDNREELRLDVAETLEPVLRAAERYEDLVRALELRLQGQSEPEERTQTLRSIAEVYDERLQKPEDAEAALLRALEDSPSDEELHTEIERLAAASDGFARYADALAERAGAIFDAVVAKDLYVRLGRISEEKLEDGRRAVEAYQKAVEHAGDEPELLEALDRLHVELKDHEQLASVLERRVEIAEADDQANLLHRLAKLQIEAFEDKALGLGTLRAALERDPAHQPTREALEALTDDKDLFEEVAEALENIYRVVGDNQALARLYDKRIQFAPTPAERVRMRLDLSKVLEDRSGDAGSALEVLEKALDDDPSDNEVLDEIERLAGATDRWKGAAEALEKAVGAREDLSSDAASELWVRAATWRKDRADDAEGAEKAFAKALEHEPENESILRSLEELQRTPGRERDLIATLRRLAELEGGVETANELRKEAKQLAQSALSDDELAESILREMIAADDADRWALGELTDLREKAEDFKEVFDLLVRQAELAADGELIKELRHRAAEVARDKLDDAKAAIDLLEQIFEDVPEDERAANALRGLYSAGDMHSELLALITRLTELATSVEERSKLRLEAAEVCGKLNADTEAVEHLRAILDEDNAHQEATLALSRLLEKTGRDEDLAELLRTQIELASERSDTEAELSYRVRLGEVQESRLGDVEKAIETFKSVLERDDKHLGALTALSRLHEGKGDKAAAAEMLDRVLAQQDGEDARETALRLADLFEAVDNAEGTRRSLETALKQDEKHAEVRDRLRAVYEKQGAWAELADMISFDADQAAEDPEKVSLLRKAAAIHADKRDDPTAAAELLAKATELAPQDRELLLLLCDAYSASGRGQKSAEVLQQIVESYGGRRSKDLATIHHRLAKAYLAEGDKERALGELDTAFKIDPGSVGVLKELGVLSLQLADEASDDAGKKTYVDRAQKTFRALLLQRLDDSAPITKAEVFYYLGVTSHKQGDKKKATQMLERALDNDKELEKAKELLAELKS